MKAQSRSLFDWNIVRPAIGDAFKKLDPRLMVKNPVMFVTMVGAALTTVGIFTATPDLRGFVAQLAILLWFTVLFANFAEAMAEGRGKAQAASLRRARKETMARRLKNGREEKVPAPMLQKGRLRGCVNATCSCIITSPCRITRTLNGSTVSYPAGRSASLLVAAARSGAPTSASIRRCGRLGPILTFSAGRVWVLR